VFRPPPPDGVLLPKSPEDFGPAIGEWCLARALAVNQHLAELAEDQRAHRWSPREGPKDPDMLRAQRVVVAGTGAVGRGIARAFRPLGCRVEGLSRSGRAVGEFHRVESVTAFAAVVPGADWLILALPLTEATWHFIDRTRLSQCAGAYLMNVGRGALLEEAMLPEALDRGWIRGAALDVFEVEPLPPESPLWQRPEVMLSPHLSGPSTVAATGDGLLECLRSFERGQPCRWVVDPGVGY